MSDDEDRDWKPGAVLETRRFKMGRCVNCRTPMTGITGPPGDPEPESAVMVCAYCGHIMEWNGRKLVPLSDEAAHAVAGNKDVLAAVELVGAFQRDLAAHPARCAACGAPGVVGQIRCLSCLKPLVFPAGGPR